MRRSTYLKICCAGVFALGLAGECSVGTYDALVREPLRRRYATIQEEVSHLEQQVRLYERRIECAEELNECGPVRTIDGHINRYFEVHIEADQ